MVRFGAYVVAAVLALGGPVQAQAANDDRGLIQAFLEDNLSDAGRDIRINGFSGALSSRATIEELTIADDDGIWFTLRGAVLDWNRRALFSGRLEVNELTAAEIVLARIPPAPESDDPPAAFEIALPDLPVAVHVASLRADRIVLGAAVAGQDAAFTVAGSVALEGGEGSIKLAMSRLDGPEATLDLSASYANETRALSVDLQASEAAGGVVSDLLSLPGQPSIEFALSGAGPVDDFAADLGLSTDGVGRLTGQGRITAQDSGHAFSADIRGDLRPLIQPDFRAPLGPVSSLAASGRRDGQGGWVLDRLALTSDGLRLSGSGQIVPGADGGIDTLHLAAEVSAEDLGRFAAITGLGLSGAADLETSGSYRPADGQFSVTANGTGKDLKIGQADIDRLLAGDSALNISIRRDVADHVVIDRLEVTTPELHADLTGRVAKSESRLRFAAELRDVGLLSPGLAGPLTASGSAASDGDEWQVAAVLASRGLRLNGSGQIVPGAGGGIDALSLSARVTADDLSGFSAITGLDLAGAADLQTSGSYRPASGQFSVTANGTGRDLRIGQADIDRLLAGDSALNISIRREVSDYIVFDRLEVKTPELYADLTGRVAETDSRLRFAAELRDVGLFAPGFSGPFSASGIAAKTGPDWQVDAELAGTAGTRADLAGSVASDGSGVDLTLGGTGPLALINRFIQPNILTGDLRFDLAMRGPPGLDALSGRASTEGANLGLADAGLSLRNIRANADIANGSAALSATSGLRAGGTIAVSGPIGLALPFAGDLAITLNGAGMAWQNILTANLDGRIAMQGPMIGGAAITGRVDVSQSEVRIPEAAPYLAGDLPAIGHLGEPAAVRASRARAGLTGEARAEDGAGVSYGLDLAISAPNRIFIRGRGLEAELGGSLTLLGTTNAPVARGRFDLIRGRLDILGKRLVLTEGWAALQGSFDPFVHVASETVSEGIAIRILVEGPASDPQVILSSEPDLPQDEILARLLFGATLADISALQALRLAAAVNTLSGRGGVGTVSRIRERFGLDDLDVTTDQAGTTGVSVGKYLGENLYSNITVDSAGRSEIQLNLSLSPSVTARGSYATDGESGIGLFFERDY